MTNVEMARKIKKMNDSYTALRDKLVQLQENCKYPGVNPTYEDIKELVAFAKCSSYDEYFDLMTFLVLDDSTEKEIKL